LTQFRTVEFTPPRRLGLAVVAELARRHGIVVQLGETPGGGTTASVLLPPILLADFATSDTAHVVVAGGTYEPIVLPAPAPAVPASDAPFLPPVDVPVPAAASASDAPFLPPVDAPAPAAAAASDAPFLPPVDVPAPAPAAATAATDEAPATGTTEAEETAPDAPTVIDLTAAERAEAAPAFPSGLPQRSPGGQMPDLGIPRDVGEDDAAQRDARQVGADLAGFQAGFARAREEAPEPLRPLTPVPAPDADEPALAEARSGNGADNDAAARATMAAPVTAMDGGLEQRVAGAQLPDTGPPRDPSAPPPHRRADDVRSALSSFQNGVARGTLEGKDWRNGEDA